MNRRLTASILAYILGVAGDDATTYYLVVVHGGFTELNPNTSRLIHQPFTWLAVETLLLASILALALLVDKASRRLTGWRTAWLIMASASAPRILAFTHNLIEAFTGSSPIPYLLKPILSLLGYQYS